MEEVPDAVVRRHLLGGAAGERATVDVAVVGGDVDVFAVGVEHVIVVQVGQRAEIDAHETRLR